MEKDLNESKSAYILNEMNNSFKHIESNKTLAFSAIKIYLLLFFALFAYASFVQTKILSLEQGLETSYFMYSSFGVILTLMTFASGWILLDYITGLIYKAIVNYKQIGYLRKLSSEQFFNNSLKNYFILPIGISEIHLTRSKHLPLAFSAINLLLLTMIYYFLQISLEVKTSLTITFSILFIFSIFFPNACKKLEEEKSIARKLAPNKTDESKTRTAIGKMKSENKNTQEYKILNYTLWGLGMIFLVMMAFNFFHSSNDKLSSLSYWIFIVEAIILVFIAPLVYRLKLIELLPKKY